MQTSPDSVPSRPLLRPRLGLFLFTFASASLAIAACGGDDELACGSGTKQVGAQCVASASSGGSAGSGGSGGGGGGTSDAGGSDATPVGPSAPTFGGIVSLAPSSDASLQVTWQPATDKVTPREDIIYRIYVATASGQQNFGTPQAVTPAGLTSYLVGGLEPSKEYYVVVRAANAASIADTNTKELSDAPEVDTTPPTFNGVKAAASKGATSVEVSWDPAQDDKTPPEGISYTVLWATTPDGAPTGTLGTLSAPGATSVIVDNLPDPEASYHFVVRARDAAGNTEENKTTISGSTLKDVDAPTFTGCSAVGQPGATNVSLTWAPAKDNTTAPDDMTYNVYAFTEPVDDTTAFGAPAGNFKGGTSGVVTSLTQKTSYYFVCRAADETGNEEKNIVFRTTTTLEDGTPPTFGGLVSVSAESTTAELRWNAARDDKTADSEIIYQIYQSETAGLATSTPPVAQSNPGTTSIVLTTLRSATTYYWAVRAEDKARNRDPNTTEVSATTLVSFANDIQPILTQHCVKPACHSADNPPQGLNMSEGFAYFFLVDVPAVEMPSLMRIKPFEPLNSYLWKKINNIQPIGGVPMPPTGNVPPTQAMKDTIQKWIEQGAKNN